MIMELKEVVDKLKELGDLPSYSSSDKSEIERLYKEVLGKEFSNFISEVIISVHFIASELRLKQDTIF